MKKRIISVICCLAVLMLSVPFSVSSETKSIEYEASIMECSLFPFDDFFESLPQGKGLPVWVMESSDDARIFTSIFEQYLETQGFPESNEAYDFVKSLSSDYFDEQSVLIFPYTTGNPGYTFEIQGVEVAGDSATVNFTFCSNGGIAPDVIVEYIFAITVSKEDIRQCTNFYYNNIKANITADFEAEFYIFDGYISEDIIKAREVEADRYYSEDLGAHYGRYIAPFVIKTAKELDDFMKICVSEDFNSFSNNLNDNFFEENTIVAVYSKTDYAPAKYEFSEIERVFLEDEYYRFRFTVDESDGKIGEQFNILLFVLDKTATENASFSAWGDRINVLGDVDGNGSADVNDYIILKRAYFGTYRLSAEQKISGDLNKNGKIDMTDYILSKRVWFGTYDLYGGLL